MHRSKVVHDTINIVMNYYAKIYNDNYNINNIKKHISIIEGIYEANLRQKARVIGDMNITDNKFCKYVKQPYDVINSDENTITLKKNGEETFIRLSHLLTTEGYTQDQILHIITSIQNISNKAFTIFVMSGSSFILHWANITSQMIQIVSFLNLSWTETKCLFSQIQCSFFPLQTASNSNIHSNQ